MTRPSDTPSPPGWLDALAVAREHVRLVALALVASLAAGAAIVSAMPRHYEATTRLLIDPRGLDLASQDVRQPAGALDQISTVVDSEAVVLTAGKLLERVVARRGLADDPEFNRTGSGTFAWLGEAVRLLLGHERAPAELAALDTLRRAVRAHRQPQSFIVDLHVRSRDPRKAAMLADTIAAEYLVMRFAVHSDAVGRASDGMTGMLAAQRRRLEEAETALQRYKVQHGLVAATGKLVSEQQLDETSTRLVLAQTETMRAAARREQLEELRKGRDVDAVGATASSPTILALRGERSGLRQRLAALATRSGPSHPDYMRLAQEVAGIERQIGEELERLVGWARLAHERAQQNEAALRRSVDAQKLTSLEAGARLVRMKELELDVEASRAVFEMFLRRSRELGEVRRIDSSAANVISPAMPPLAPGGLPALVALLGASLCGLGIGIAAALVRDRADPVLRGMRHLRQATGRVGIEVGVDGGLAGKPAAAELQSAARHLRHALGRAVAGRTPAVVLVTSAADRLQHGAVAKALVAALADGAEHVALLDSSPASRQDFDAGDHDIVVVDAVTMQNPRALAAWRGVVDLVVVVAEAGVTGKAELAGALAALDGFPACWPLLLAGRPQAGG